MGASAESTRAALRTVGLYVTKQGANMMESETEQQTARAEICKGLGNLCGSDLLAILTLVWRLGTNGKDAG